MTKLIKEHNIPGSSKPKEEHKGDRKPSKIDNLYQQEIIPYVRQFPPEEVNNHRKLIKSFWISGRYLEAQNFSRTLNQELTPMKFNPNLNVSNLAKDDITQKMLEFAFKEMAEEKQSLNARGDGSCLGIHTTSEECLTFK